MALPNDVREISKYMHISLIGGELYENSTRVKDKDARGLRMHHSERSQKQGNVASSWTVWYV